MDSDPSLPSNGEPAPKPALPPVLPPSGGHIIRLFVVPAVIVLVVVVLLLGGLSVRDWFLGGARPTDHYLADMRSANPDVRWRAATDFAQKLKRDPQLAADVHLGLDLTELLEPAVDELDRLAAAIDKSSDRKAAVEAFKMQREYVRFLTACLGNLSVPVGVPVLARLADKDRGGEPKTTALLRRQAVWALANLGENRRQFDTLPADEKGKEQREQQRAKVLADLASESVSTGAQRGRWARLTLNRLQGTEDFGVIAALAQCAEADDPDLRSLTAFALGFWTGSPTENALAEKTLLKLSNPDVERGQGERVLLSKDD